MKTKLYNSLILFICILFCLLKPNKSWAYECLVDGIGYYLYYGAAEVAPGYQHGESIYSGDVIIPESFVYNGQTYSVTSISPNAFASHEVVQYTNSRLTSVTIPNSVTLIQDGAFRCCTGLTSMTIPNSVTTLGEGVFDGCNNLKTVIIGSGLNQIYNFGLSPFGGCTSLASIIVDPNNKTFDSRDNCIAIIETSTNTLIAGCDNTIIPNSVTSIGNGAFGDCRGLTSLTIPNSVTSIGEDAFSGCTCLTSIIVDSNNKTFDSRDNCNAIIETSTNTLVVGCKNTIIPNSVTSIGSFAFYGCTGLTSVTIPNGVTEIGFSSFLGCTGLTSVTIANSVASIGVQSFWGCTGLTSVTIPSSVTSIGSSAFYGCTGLSSITVENEMPISIDNSVFEYVEKSICKLYVPAGSKIAYENAEGWKEFQNIVEYDTDISTLDNAIYIDRIEGRIGRTMDIPVKVKNSYDFRGFQFIMELPEGTTVNSWKLSMDRLPEGATLSDKIATQKIEGNRIQVACSLNYGDATFTGNDGEIATVNVTFSEDMEVGEYPIYLTACDISDAGGTDNKLSDIKATLVLEDYVDGDANGDGEVLIGDVVAILNYIVGVTSENFNEKAADANGDGEILIGDVIAVLNIIVGF